MYKLRHYAYLRVDCGRRCIDYSDRLLMARSQQWRFETKAEGAVNTRLSSTLVRCIFTICVRIPTNNNVGKADSSFLSFG